LLPGIVPPHDTTDTDNEVEFYWVGSDARIAGTLVHRWLQLIADERASTQVGNQFELRKVTSRWLQESGISQAAASPILDRVEGAITAMLDDEKGRWILDGEGHAELALTGVANDELVSVILDRVRIAEDDTHWIIDYKTSSHEGGNLAAFLQAEADRYKVQLARYASIYENWSGANVKCALYFPLLQSFVEVPV